MPTTPSAPESLRSRPTKMAEKRYAPDIPWEELPFQRAGQRGRPKNGAAHLALTPRTVKMPEPIWKAFADAASA